MYFETWEEFIAMGGHGFYVWLAYGVSVTLIVGWALLQRQRSQRVRLQIQQRIRRQEQQN